MAATVANFVEIVSVWVSSALTWVGEILDVVEKEPILIMFLVVGFVGLGIGFITRLLRMR